MIERLARLCVGVGLLWVMAVVTTGLLAGPQAPATWFALLDRVLAPDLRRWLYRLLSYVIVPVGMLTCVRDILRDPLPLWVKGAAPGAFLAVYALFLAAAGAEIGHPLLATVDPLVAGVVPGVLSESGATPARGWLLRALALFLLLGGAPGLLGALVGLLAGPGDRRAGG